MKKRFQVQGDSKNTFMNIELDLVIEDDSIGATCSVLGGTFKIIQNGIILVLTDKDWCLTLVDITPKIQEIAPKLTANENLLIDTKLKEIDVQCKCTYEELYYELESEWKFLQVATGEPIPFDYSERLQLFTFKESWGFKDNNFDNVSVGSFSRINEQGRNI